MPSQDLCRNPGHFKEHRIEWSGAPVLRNSRHDHQCCQASPEHFPFHHPTALRAMMLRSRNHVVAMVLVLLMNLVACKQSLCNRQKTSSQGFCSKQNGGTLQTGDEAQKGHDTKGWERVFPSPCLTGAWNLSSCRFLKVSLRR